MFLYINATSNERYLQSRYHKVLHKELENCLHSAKSNTFVGLYMKMGYNYPIYRLLDMSATLTKILFPNVYNEITLELDVAMPIHSALEMKYKLQERGINRINLSGSLIEDFRSFVICAEMVYDTFENISLDIQINDHVSSAHWRSVLNSLITLPVVHVSLSIGERVGEWIIDYFYLFKAMMESGGFEHYGLFHFAKKGYRSRYMEHVWNQQPIYGCGSGAQTSLGRIRWTNPARTKEYLECGSKNALSKPNFEELTDQQYVLEKLMLNLRRSKGVSVEFLKSIGKESRMTVREQMNQLCSEGFLRWKNDHLVLTPKGYFVEQEILRRLM